MFLENKYTKLYYRIVDSAKTRTIKSPLFGYKERHHIIPRALGGDNKSENLVELTAKEHFVVHHLLTKMTASESKRKMLLALRFLSKSSKTHLNNRIKITAKLYNSINESIACDQRKRNFETFKIVIALCNSLGHIPVETSPNKTIRSASCFIKRVTNIKDSYYDKTMSDAFNKYPTFRELQKQKSFENLISWCKIHNRLPSHYGSKEENRLSKFYYSLINPNNKIYDRNMTTIIASFNFDTLRTSRVKLKSNQHSKKITK